VKLFDEHPETNKRIIDKQGLTCSEWITALKMACNVIPVRTLPGRSTNNNPLCRHCKERETLPHVLGNCHVGELLRNNRHHDIRRCIAKHLRQKGWLTYEEVHCTSETGSNKRVDIICYKANTKEGFIIDPTVRTEISHEQAEEVNREKKAHYNPCIEYFKEKYKLDSIEVMGLLVGARGTIFRKFEEFRKRFLLPKSITKEISILSIRGSHRIIHNHLYNSR
jgi:hypothetical protein